jgi:glycosyltransferase involved in cell wall biosynthesis
MKQLLAVSWEMPPLSGPRAVQVTRSLCQLAIHGWQSRVVCFSPRSTRYNQDYAVSPETESEGAVTRIPVPSPEEWLVFRALWRVCPPLKRLPDEKRVWVRGALAASRRALAERPADVLVSFAQPWSDHLVGLRLHRETRLPWVAHFSDPWVDSPYQRGSAWLRRACDRMEHDVAAEATRLVFVNQQTADRVMAKYPPAWRARVAVVPQGFDARHTPPPMPHPRQPGPLRVAYTGRFYGGARTPEALFTALTLAQRDAPLAGRLTVEVVGGAMAPYERRSVQLGLAGLVRFSGRRSPEGAQAVASSADLLLVIDAPSRGVNLFLPSKLIDYLPLRIPILGLTPAAGASADLLRRLGYPVVDPSDPRAIADTLMRLLAQHEHGMLSVSACHDAVAAAYDIRETTRALHAVLEEAASVG